jgi:predicted phosphodiesterase
MKLQIISDLHIDANNICQFSKLIKPLCKNLAILGDTCNSHTNGNLHELIKYCVDKFEHVFYITGNHEYYGTNKQVRYKGIDPSHFNKHNYKPLMGTVEKYFEDIPYDNFHYLQRDKFIINGTKILGCTLWSNIPEHKFDNVLSYVNDYNVIHTEDGLITPQQTNDFFNRDLKWLHMELQEKIPTIILTHHAPVIDCCDVKYNGKQEGFATDLTDTIYRHDHLLMWGFGHTHYTYNKKINNCNVISNPKGLGNECPKYNSSIIDIN